MFIYSFKAQNLKLHLAILLSVLSVICVMIFIPFENDSALVSTTAASKNVSEKNFKNIETFEDRKKFLKQFGWEIEPEAKDITLITIPVNFDQVYEKYNNLQLNEGLDLKKYKGKTVKKYTYLVSNHDFNGVIYANLLIYKNTVIGGDLSSAVSGGVIHGFTKDNLFQT